MIYKTYNTNLNNLNNYLDDYGVAVIPNILSVEECIYFRNQIWDELKYVSQNRFDINKITIQTFNKRAFNSIFAH